MIYITETDIFKKGKTIYHFDHVLRETGELINNGYHEIYVNAEINDGTELAEYMKLFKSPDVMDNQKYPNLCDAVRYYKNGKGRDIMCAITTKRPRQCLGRFKKLLYIRKTLQYKYYKRKRH